MDHPIESRFVICERRAVGRHAFVNFFKSKKAGVQPCVVASLLAVGRINPNNTESGFSHIAERLSY